MGVRSEIESAVISYGSGGGQRRKPLLYVESERNIGLIVFEHDIVLRLVLFYEIVLEKEGLFLVARQYERDIFD